MKNHIILALLILPSILSSQVSSGDIKDVRTAVSVIDTMYNVRLNTLSDTLLHVIRGVRDDSTQYWRGTYSIDEDGVIEAIDSLRYISRINSFSRPVRSAEGAFVLWISQSLSQGLTAVLQRADSTSGSVDPSGWNGSTESMDITRRNWDPRLILTEPWYSDETFSYQLNVAVSWKWDMSRRPYLWFITTYRYTSTNGSIYDDYGLASLLSLDRADAMNDICQIGSTDDLLWVGRAVSSVVARPILMDRTDWKSDPSIPSYSNISSTTLQSSFVPRRSVVAHLSGTNNAIIAYADANSDLRFKSVSVSDGETGETIGSYNHSIDMDPIRLFDIGNNYFAAILAGKDSTLWIKTGHVDPTDMSIEMTLDSAYIDSCYWLTTETDVYQGDQLYIVHADADLYKTEDDSVHSIAIVYRRKHDDIHGMMTSVVVHGGITSDPSGDEGWNHTRSGVVPNSINVIPVGRIKQASGIHKGG